MGFNRRLTRRVGLYPFPLMVASARVALAAKLRLRLRAHRFNGLGFAGRSCRLPAEGPRLSAPVP